MRPVAERILDAFQLTRLSLAFGAVCELWLVTLLTRADPRYVHLPVYHMPLWKALVCTGVVSVGLFAFAASLNDLLDVRHDRRFSPDRPLAAGRIRTSSAALLSFGALMAAVVCARALGDSQLRIDPGGVGAWEVVGGHGYRLVAAITISAPTRRNVAPLRCMRGRSARVIRCALGRAMCGR